MKITKRNRQTITNSCQVSECDKLKDDENISIQSACAVEGMTEEDVNMSDWSNEEICEFIKHYFDNITGYPISVVYDRIDEVDENSPLFEQLGIEDAAESISDFLSNHTDWDEEKVDQFYYVLEDDLFMENEKNKKVTSACDVNSGSELDYMLNGSDQYAVEQALDMLHSGDADDIETVVRYAVNVVNNGNAEPEYEDEDFYQEEADYDTVLRYVKSKRGIKSCSVQSSTSVEEVLTFFKDKLGWDTSREDVRNYAEGVSEYMDMNEEADQPYTLDEWYKDTKMNYPEDIEEFESEKIETGCHEEVTAASRYDDADYFDELFVAIDNAIEEQGFKSVCRFLDDDYLEIQLFYEDDEEFDNAIYTYVTELDVIEPNLEDVESDAEIIADDVVEEYYNSGGTESGQFEEIESKQVLDSDGFMTDYTMYRDNKDGTYFFMFGDKELYGPDRNWADHEEETEEGAYEWFESYEGFEDEEDY